MARSTAGNLVKRLGKLPATSGGQLCCSASSSTSTASRSFSTSTPRPDDEASTSAAGSSSKSRAPRRDSPSSSSSASSSSSEASQRGGGRRGSRPGFSSSSPSTLRSGPYGDRRQPNLSKLPPYSEWVKGPGKNMFGTPPDGWGPHWIGETPFPLNPYFKPQPPTSQRVRDRMWTLHKADSQKNSIRALSGSFGLTMERTLAILRLKALEDEMTAKSIPLQTDFQSNMERLLGSSIETPNVKKGRSLPLTDAAPADSKTKPSSTSLGRIVEIAEAAPAKEEEKGAQAATKKQQKGDSEEQVDSALRKALDEERSIQKARRASVPTGGPAPSLLREANAHLSHRESEAARMGTYQVPPSKGGARASVVQGRAGLSVLDLARAAAKKMEVAGGAGGAEGERGGMMESYKGAGTLERNVKRQQKKQRRRERLRLQQGQVQGQGEMVVEQGVDEVDVAKEAGVQ